MEHQQLKGPGGSLHGGVEASHQRSPMRYFRKIKQMGSLQIQRIKRQSLDKMSLQNEKDRTSAGMFMRNQRSTLRTLQKIQINECDRRLFQMKTLSLASQIRSNFNLLKELKFELSSDAETVFVKTLGNNHKQLRHLSIEFQYSSKITNEGVKTLATKIKRHYPNILLLNLTFDNCAKINDETISIVVTNALKRLDKLLGLELYWPSSITYEGALILAEHIGNNMNQLLRLNLTFDNGRLTDQGIKALATQFNNLKKLRQLALRFLICQFITNQGVLALSQFIGIHLRQLNQLSLDFSFCLNVTDQGAEALVREVGQNLNQLQLLDLQFHGCDVTDKTVLALSSQIGHIQTLTHLMLNFRNCKGISDVSIAALAGRIRESLSGLQNLGLNFSECYNISKRSLQALSNSIGSLQNLKQLSLFLQDIQLPNEAILPLLNLNGNQLTHLSLAFSNCKPITDQLFKALAIKLETNFRQLRALNLCFESCSNMTGEGALMLVNQIDSILPLQEIYLNVLNISQDSNELGEVLIALRKKWSKRLERFRLYFQ